MTLKIISLALIIYQASGESFGATSGILSRLYKKAANENRPLIVILDKTPKHHNDRHSWHSKSLENEDGSMPVSLLDLFNNKRLSLNINKQNSFDRPIEDYRGDAKSSHSDLIRLKNRLEREKRLRKERRERRERRDRYQDKYSDKTLDRKEKSRYQDRYDNRENREYNRADDRNDYEQRSRERDDKLALRSSVIKNLLRISNDLNCDAKDECQDKCNGEYNGKKRDECENVCEVKYECEESDSDPCDENSGECRDSEEKTGSTRGERLITVTPKCTRC